MVAFNQQVPTVNPPEWTNVSRPISDINLPADKSKAMMISGIAEGIDSATKVAENIDQDVIKEKTRAGVEALRDATTLAYENVRTGLATGQPVNPQAANVAGLSLLQKTAQNVPDDLQNGLDRAQDLATARAQGTLKANDTLYTGALNSLAKQLRSEYPGHKDFIDEQIARISGKNPANAYMDNLLQDISRLATNSDSFEKKLMSKAMENYGDINVVNAITKYRAGMDPTGAGLSKAVYGAEADKLNHQKAMNNFQEDEAAGKLDTEKVKSQAQQSAQNTVFRNFNGVVADTLGLTPEKAQQIISEYQQGKTSSINPQQWESIAQALEASRDQTYNAIKNNFNSYGISRRLKNPADEQAIINNELGFYDRAIAAVRNPDKGLFFEMQRRAKGIQDGANYQALSGPMGDFLTKTKVLQDSAGPILTNYVAQQALQKGYLGRMQDWFGDATQKAMLPEDPRIGNNGKSLTADVQTAKRAAATQGVKFDPRLYNDLVSNVNLIEQAGKQGKTDTAKEVVKYMFDPNRNADFVKQWGRDFTDANGVKHNGYFAYYDMLTRPKVVNAVYDLKDPEASIMFHNWNEHQFHSLFGNEVQALNKIQGDRANPAKLEWNADTNQMKLVFANKPQTTVDQNYQRWAQDSISNLNRGFTNLAYMYKKENQDPSEGIFTMLQQMSYTPVEGLSGKLPKMVIDAINASQFQPSEQERLRSTFQRLGQ